MIDNSVIAASHTDQKVIVTPKLRLDLGCGDNKKEGFLGVDFTQTPSVDVVHDLFTFPWPFETSSVDEIFASQFFEHVPARLRPKFMDEVWRVLKPGAVALFVTPSADSNRAIQDFTHEWPPICFESYLYFDRDWRVANKLTHGHYEMACHLKIQSSGEAYYPDISGRSDEFRAFASQHYRNATIDKHITLVAVK